MSSGMAVFSQNWADYLLNHYYLLNCNSHGSFKTTQVFLIHSGLIPFIYHPKFSSLSIFQQSQGAALSCRCKVSRLAFVCLSWEVRAPHPRCHPIKTLGYGKLSRQQGMSVHWDHSHLWVS